MKTEKKGNTNVSTRSFITAIVVIFVLMILTYVLTLVVPGGAYPRIENSDGNLIIDTNGEFSYIDGGISFWKWIASPILVLGASGNVALIAVIAFLLVIGGVFNALDHCGLMKYMLDKMVHRFGGVRYRLMAIIMLFFMTLGSLIGSFEECIPLVPLVIALSVKTAGASVVAYPSAVCAEIALYASSPCVFTHVALSVSALRRALQKVVSEASSFFTTSTAWG